MASSHPAHSSLEAGLEAVLSLIGEGILIADGAGRIRLANRAAREALDLGPDADLEDRKLEDVAPPGPLRQAFLRARKEDAFSEDVDLSTKDRRRIIRVRSASAGREGTVVSVRDVAVEKQIEGVKKEFLLSVTHDLRNPVSSIIGFCEFLSKGAAGALKPEQKGMIASIQSAAGRLMAMVNNIIDSSNLETGRMEVNLKSASLSEIAGRSVEFLGPSASRRNVAIELSAGKDCMMIVDPDLIERVFVNLISNAVKFARDGGRVAVAIEEGRDAFKVCVSDDGEGVPAAYRERIFGKFGQVPGQRKGGTGLGLAVCKRAVEAHLGRIWVESEPDRGARFYFTVPKGLTVDSEGRVFRGIKA